MTNTTRAPLDADTERERGKSRTPEQALPKLSTAAWHSLSGDITRISLWRMTRALPAALKLIVGTAWQVNRGAVLLGVAAHLMSGLVAGFGLLAVTRMLTALLTAGPTPDRVLDAVPALLTLSVAFALPRQGRTRSVRSGLAHRGCPDSRSWQRVRCAGDAPAAPPSRP